MAQMMQFYLSNSGNFNFGLVDQILDYGCWCQIRTADGPVSGKGLAYIFCLN